MEILDNNDEHKQLLWKILSSVERIDATLIGNSYTNNKGLIHKVEAQGDLLEHIDKRVLMLESSLDNDENTEKKTNSLWNTAAAWLAAVAALAAAIFAASPKK